jgi:adenine specific DNA methylase Mod
MTNINENKFYQALESIFTGANIEGESGYVNLLKIKSNYYRLILEQFKKDVNNEPIITDSFKEEFFDKLYSFFEKYFSESGSVYFVKTANWQRVYEQVYTDNKDVVLFWKTHMLYYVKSDILFQSIDVTVTDEESKKEYNFYFDVGTLQAKQNNEKRQIIFTFRETREEKNNVDLINNKEGKKVFVFDVSYSEKGTKTKIDEIIKQTKIPEHILEKAFATFKKQSEVDFFINKNAEKFLTEQLDMYLHQILLDEENKFDQKRLDQLKTIKTFALKIIKFISQFENELVRVWNKPKFVLNSNYVITLDKLSDQILEKITKHKNLPEQIKEWIELGMVDEGFKIDDLVNNDLLKTRNEKYKYLPIDTKYFKDLELDILALFINLDEALDGRLIHSENYQALNTLLPKYKEKVQCIYIDPPYNTGTDFIFLDKFQDSTWLNIINDRLEISKKFLKDDGVLYLHLDHIAEHYGRQILDKVFDNNAFKAKITWNTGDNISGFKSQALNWIRQADFIHFYSKSEKYKFIKAFEVLDKIDSIGWLDILGKDKKEQYIEKWVNGSFIKEKVNLNVKAKGTIWNDIYSFMYSEPRITESLSFVSNQKPENLLRRIIQTSSDSKDYILDFFLGSGTTCAVAQKLNRKWIGVEMGEYFSEIYLDTVKIKKQKDENEEDIEDNNSAIVEILSETDKEKTVLMKKIGILGRMKIVLKGDKEFKAIHSPVIRKPHLSKDINWQGSGFFKYYSLEQYEDTLRNMKYKDSSPKGIFDTRKPFEQYIFYADEKFAHVLEVNQDKLDINFDKLYQNIDFAETISNLLGLPIKRITKTSVVLQDKDIEREIKTDYKNMTNEEKLEFIRLLKPLLWWGD